MLDALSYEFIQNALIAGVLVSIIAGIIGSLIVANRMVFLAGGIFAVIAALFMAFVTINQRERIDTFIGLIWAVGMAIGIILVDLTPGYNVDLMSYLFGSILAVNRDDIYFMSILLVAILVVLALWYRDILAVSYDSEYAALCGINVKFFYTLMLVLSALTVVIAIKVVGLILVIALLTIPIYIAQNLSSSLLNMMFISGFIASLFTVIGLWFSYTYDLTSGACIILVSAVSLIIFMLLRGIK